MSKTVSRAASILFAILMSLLIFTFPDKTFESVSASWERCTTSLLPSIFPMSVLSKQICPMLFFGQSRFYSLLSKLTGFSQHELPVFLTSLICGYPIPAVLAKDMAETGVMTKQEAKRAVALCNNASPAFLIFFVGRCVFGSLTFGVKLYLCQTLSVMTVAHFKKTAGERPVFGMPLRESLSESVVRSAKGTLVLFGFVIFFSLAGDLVKAILALAKIPPTFGGIFAGFFESSAGLAGMSQFPLCAKIPMTCFFCSFGGLSVFFQTKASATDELVNTYGYFSARLAIFAGMMFFLFPSMFLSKSSLL